MNLTYAVGRPISADEFRDVLERSTLGARRPVDDLRRLGAMLENADLMVTCWDREKLVGIARSVTDFYYCCYLSDLAVDTAYQKRGIGRRLIAEMRAKLQADCKVILLSAPAAVDYYPHIGFRRHEQSWVLS